MKTIFFCEKFFNQNKNDEREREIGKEIISRVNKISNKFHGDINTVFSTEIISIIGLNLYRKLIFT